MVWIHGGYPNFVVGWVAGILNGLGVASFAAWVFLELQSPRYLQNLLANFTIS
jgi:hypothetical protein